MNPSKTLMALGLGIFAVGAWMAYGPRIPGLNRLGRLPGDLRFEGENFRFYFPWVSCLVVSAVVTLILKWWGRLK